jgi:hypothetical protein
MWPCLLELSLVRDLTRLTRRVVEIDSSLAPRAEVGWTPPALEVDLVLDHRAVDSMLTPGAVEVDSLLAPRGMVGSNPPAVEVVSMLAPGVEVDSMKDICRRRRHPLHHPQKAYSNPIRSQRNRKSSEILNTSSIIVGLENASATF